MCFGGDSEGEEDGDMDVDTSKQREEVAHALAAAESLHQTKDSASSDPLQDVSDGLRELNMDRYDEEDDGTFLHFASYALFDLC